MSDDIHNKIQHVLDFCDDIAIATVRPDGYPQATTVSYVNDGLRIYFGTGDASQKARNIAHCDKVSATVTCPYEGWNEIMGVSLAGRARRVTDPEEFGRVGALMFKKFPQIAAYMPEDPKALAIFCIAPSVISLLDYSKGFGHTDLVELGVS